MTETPLALPAIDPRTEAAGEQFRSAATIVLCLCVATLLLCFAVVFFAPLPFRPNATSPTSLLQAPSSTHWFGTDTLGRDVLSRVIVAGRTDLPLVLAGTAAALVVGVSLGLAVTVRSRWSERFMRGVDMFQAFPVLILAIGIVSLAGNNLAMVVVAIAMIFAPVFVRLVRAEGLAVRESRYVEAARSIGASNRRILIRHVMPNIRGIIFAQAALTASRSIAVIAGLAFLGIGVTPPTASWGAMIQTGAEQLASGQWWISVFPGAAVVVVVLLFNWLGDSLDAVVNGQRR